jgi:hypothetical protein
MADAVVVSKIVFEGENRAGKAIKEAEEQASKLGDKLKGAADKSGDMERGLIGLKDIIGDMGGPLGEVADRFGGIEGVIKGLPGMLGPIALAAAGVAAGVMYYYKQAEEARDKALDAQKQILAEQRQSVEVMAKEAGLDAELVIEAEKRLTVEQAQLQTRTALTEKTLAQEALLEALKGEDQTAIANARTLLGIKQEQVKTAYQAVDQAIRLNGIEALRKSAALDGTLAAQREEVEISRIADTRARTDEQAIRLRRQILTVEKDLNQASKDRIDLQQGLELAQRSGNIKQVRDYTKQLEDATNRQAEASNKQIDLEGKLFSVVRERDTYEAGESGKREARASKAAGNRQRREQERLRHEQEVERVSKEYADRAVERLNAYGREFLRLVKLEREAQASLVESKAQLEQAQIDASVDPEQKAQLEYLRERRRLTQELTAVQRDLGRGAADSANRQMALLTRLDTLERKRVTEQAERKQQQADEQIALGFQVADAAVGALSIVEGAELAAAGVKATLAVAEGLYAVAKSGPAGIPQLIAGIAAAAQFAIAAGTSAPQIPSGGGGGGGGGQSMAPAGTADSRPITINVQGAIIGTPQQVGQSVNKALKSLKGTGYTVKAGA